MTKVKICGLTNLEDALAAESLGADFLGFIFFDKSPRAIGVDNARVIIKGLKGKARKVGLFFDQDLALVKDTAECLGLDLLQIHGSEKPEYVTALKKDFAVIKTFRVKKGFDFGALGEYSMADYFLFDTYKEGIAGGTGIAFDWDILSGVRINKPVFLAGGLKPANVEKAAGKVLPYAVDVASGVEESVGKKSRKLMEEFINAVK